MGIFNKKSEVSWVDVLKSSFNNDECITAMCEAHAIDLISRTIAATELQVQRCDKKTGKVQIKKDNVYYRLNVKPNINENGTDFKNRLVKKLLTKGKALIILEKSAKTSTHFMFIAQDDYDCDSEIIKGKTFKNVSIADEENNQKELKGKTYKSGNGECIYITYENKEAKTGLDSFKTKAEKILQIAEKAYKSANVNKWRLTNSGAQPSMIDSETGEEISYEEYSKKITNGLLDEEESIVLLSKIFDLYLLNKDKSKDLSDREKAIKDIGDKVAMMYDIPLDVFYGSKTEKSNGNNDFITFSCNPIMKTIEDSLTGELIGETDFVKGERILFNRFCMQHIDITTLGTSFDKLRSNGFSFNQICAMINMPEIDEPWANEHYITKNYADVKGGAKEDE